MSGFVSTVALAARSAYQLAYEVSPIILQAGLAATTPGGLLPIISLTGQVASLLLAVATTGSISLDDFFAQYIPISGGTLIDNSIGAYPFANQQVAGNAIIQNPTAMSLLMICPNNQPGSYITKLPIVTSLVTSLKQHGALGGYYAVMTPAFPYTNGVLLRMVDVTPGDSKQFQSQFQLDFYFPLITQAQAAAAQGNLMQSATNGSQITGTPTWTGAVTNFLAAPAI
jgi:hypothetical protein